MRPGSDAAAASGRSTTGSDRNFGGPHASINAVRDIDRGAMDGFVGSAVRGTLGCGSTATTRTACARRRRRRDGLPRRPRHPELLGLRAATTCSRTTCSSRTRRGACPAHLFLVCEWSAKCSVKDAPMSCVSAPNHPDEPPDFRGDHQAHDTDYAWTDLTYLLHEQHVSWRYYVVEGRRAGLRGRRRRPARRSAERETPGIWNPLPYFTTVPAGRPARQRHVAAELLRRGAAGTLPAVSWVVPNDARQRASRRVACQSGQAYVTRLVNAVMRSPDWSSTAIFLAWDDWGGFYDHVDPPKVDGAGYGLRVPGHRDQPVREAGLRRPPDAELRRLREVHRGRLPRRAATRPDHRRTSRSAPRRSREPADPRQPLHDFDFTQKPRPPLILRPYPRL